MNNDWEKKLQALAGTVLRDEDYFEVHYKYIKSFITSLLEEKNQDIADYKDQIIVQQARIERLNGEVEALAKMDITTKDGVFDKIKIDNDVAPDMVYVMNKKQYEAIKEGKLDYFKEGKE